MPNTSHGKHRVRRGGREYSGVITDGIYGRVRAYGPFGEGSVCDRTVRQSPATERKRALSELRQNALRQNAATEGVLPQAKSLYSSQHRCLYYVCNGCSPFPPEEIQRPVRVCNMSCGKGEAHGGPLLMPDTIIHTWGTATFTAPRVAVPNHVHTYPGPTKPFMRRHEVPLASPKAACMQ